VFGHYGHMFVFGHYGQMFVVFYMFVYVSHTCFEHENDHIVLALSKRYHTF